MTPRSSSRHLMPHSRHNRLNGSLQCARKIVEGALASPTITPEAERALATALSALYAACTETYNRRVNPDGSIWTREEPKL